MNRIEAAELKTAGSLINSLYTNFNCDALGYTYHVNWLYICIISNKVYWKKIIYEIIRKSNAPVQRPSIFHAPYFIKELKNFLDILLDPSSNT